MRSKAKPLMLMEKWKLLLASFKPGVTPLDTATLSAAVKELNTVLSELVK
jgi:hypothetical protein